MYYGSTEPGVLPVDGLRRKAAELRLHFQKIFQAKPYGRRIIHSFRMAEAKGLNGIGCDRTLLLTLLKLIE